MQPTHVFTLANRTMKKSLLAVASVMLSFGVLLGSAPAAALTVEGIWDADTNSFIFYDSNLGSGTEIFGTLGRTDYGWYQLQIQTNSISLYPKNFASYAYSPGYYSFSQVKGPSQFGYSYAMYSGYFDEHPIHAPIGGEFSWTEFDEHGRIAGNAYYGILPEMENWNNPVVVYGHLFYYYSQPGMAMPIIPEDYILGTTSLSVYDIYYMVLENFPETSLFSGYGIFDFQNSFVTFAEGDSLSLSEILRDTRSKSYRFIDGNIDLSWGQSGIRGEADFNREIVGISLAYNLPAIPEPETWAMLLAGLGIVGAVTRKQA
jgi:hypothetical protein